MNEHLGSAMQDNLLILLTWHDKEAKLIKGAFDFNLFDSNIHRDLALKCVDFITEFNETPKDHLPDLVENVIEGKDKKKANLYRKILENLYFAKDDINVEFVLKELNNFIEGQSLKIGITEAAKKLKQGDIEGAKHDITSSYNKSLTLFSPGLFFKDDFLKVFDNFKDDSDRILTGIPYFDKISLGPAPKELMITVSPPSQGKSWSLVHYAKMSLLQGKKVLVITLEMSEVKYLLRFIQSLLSISKRKSSSHEIINFILDDEGDFTTFDFSKVDRMSFDETDSSAYVRKKIDKFKNRMSLFVKEFPMGKLTIKGLETYLENLFNNYNYIPDVILIDYADLFELDSSSLRASTGAVYKNLRGLASDRVIAAVTASQTNRLAVGKKVITLEDLSEDYSKGMTADIVVTYNQTPLEKAYGLARLYVAKNRDEDSGRTILISQNYGLGQFCLDSTLLPRDNLYWKEIAELEGDKTDRDE
jgi:hypothetical protein